MGSDAQVVSVYLQPPPPVRPLLAFCISLSPSSVFQQAASPVHEIKRVFICKLNPGSPAGAKLMLYIQPKRIHTRLFPYSSPPAAIRPSPLPPRREGWRGVIMKMVVVVCARVCCLLLAVAKKEILVFSTELIVHRTMYKNDKM